MLTLTFLSVLGLLLLFFGFSQNQGLVRLLASLGLLAAGAVLILGNQNLLMPEGLDTQLNFDGFAVRFSTLILVFAFCVAIMSGRFLSREHVQQPEFLAVMVFSAVGAVMLTAFTHMVTLFVGLETMGISLYILAGTDKKSASSNEAALKYLLLGSFATCLILFGMAMLYGATGSLDFSAMQNLNAEVVDSNLFRIGIFFLLVGILFKVAAAPFHFWSPDVYEGSPTLVMLFMSVVVKIASFAALYRIFGHYLNGLSHFWWNVMYYAAFGSLIAGNFLALIQRSLKRQLAFSSISHTGYLLFAILVVQSEQVEAGLFFYLLAYGISQVVAFSVLMSWFPESENIYLNQLRGAAKSDPTGAFVLTLAFLSMAGIPLTGGFFGKLFMFSPAMGNGLTHLLIAGILSSVVGAAYYFRPIINVWSSNEAPSIDNGSSLKWVALAGGVLLLVTGLFPDTVMGLLEHL